MTAVACPLTPATRPLRVIPGGQSSPTALPVELAARADYEGTLNAAATVLRVLVPILLRPSWNAGPDYALVADLTGRWLAKVREASRRYDLATRWDGYRHLAAATRTVRAA